MNFHQIRWALSHISCPLCGLNVPLTSFDPKSLDLDLKLVSFRGLGRGKGFTLSETYSVLGDDYYSPIVADRVISLCRLYITEGIVSFNEIFEKLGLDDEILKSGKYVAKKEYGKAIVQNVIYQQHLTFERENSRKMQYRLNSLVLDVAKEEKKRKIERIVERILARIIQSCDAEIMEDGKFSWIVIVNKIEAEGYEVLKDISKVLNEDVRKQLSLRLRGRSRIMQIMLKELLLKKRKTITDLARGL